MRILVVEDKELHRMSATATLAGHDVVIVKSYDEAMKLLDMRPDYNEVHRLMAEAGFAKYPDKDEPERWEAYDKAHDEAVVKATPVFTFDAVLTDLMMPMSEETLAPGVFDPSEQVPYGFVIALKAAACGAKFVAVVTDTNHHQGAMSASFDHLSEAYYSEGGFKPNFVVNGARMMFVHAPFTGVPGTICPKCHGTKQYEHDCYTCQGTGAKLEWYPAGRITQYSRQVPVEGTVCEKCQGQRRVTDACGCGDGFRQDGKDWGRVLADLMGEKWENKKPAKDTR